MRVSNKEKEELFDGAASAFGTFGVVTLLELQLKRIRNDLRHPQFKN